MCTFLCNTARNTFNATSNQEKFTVAPKSRRNKTMKIESSTSVVQLLYRRVKLPHNLQLSLQCPILLHTPPLQGKKTIWDFKIGYMYLDPR